MDTKELKVNVIGTGADGKPVEIILREGEAAKPAELDHKVNVTGSIYGPGEYIKKNYKPIFKLVDGRMVADFEVLDNKMPTGIISFGLERNNLFIKFDESPASDANGAVITGRLVENPDLQAWRINDMRHHFLNKDLQKFIIANAFALAPGVAAEMRKALLNFDVKFEQQVKKTDDRQGNTEDTFKSFLKYEGEHFPKQLQITLPLFKGTPRRSFTVDIELDRVGNEVGFSFWCLEMEDIIRDTAEAIITDELKPFRDVFVTIEQI